MLAKEVIARFPEKVRFVEEDFASSDLAKQNGISRYPAFFVDGVLIAGPRDFYDWGERVQPRYSPWDQTAKREKFQADLQRAIEDSLAGRKLEPAAGNSEAHAAAATPKMPEISLKDLEGEMLGNHDLFGKVVLLEFWATWCVPCARTLPWLGAAAQRYGDEVEVLAIAMSSPEELVHTRVAELDLPIRWAIADDSITEAFGPIAALPTLHVFDRTGKLAGSFIGAPPDLHVNVQRLLSQLIPTGQPESLKPAKDQIIVALQELRTFLEALSDNQAESYARDLDVVEVLLNQEHTLAALAQLSIPSINIRAYAYMEAHKDEVKDLDAFEAKWQEASAAMHAAEEAFEATPIRENNALKGMAELAQQSARPYTDSAMLYAKADTPASGLLYLGKARGQIRYATLCRSLNLPEDRQSIINIEPSELIAEIEAKTQQIFAHGDAAQRNDPALLILNSNLKTAHSLLRDGRPMGAIYQGLMARLQLAIIVHRDRDVPDLEELSEAWEQTLDRIDASETDSSLAQLFCQQVGIILEKPDAESGDLLRAALLLEKILPLVLPD